MVLTGRLASWFLSAPYGLPLHRIAVLGLALLFTVAPIGAKACTAPVDPVILTVCGDFNGDGAVDETGFTLPALKDIGSETIETSTIWTDGPQTFTGVWLRDLMDHLNPVRGDMTITALNDYSVTLPLSDVVTGAMLLAYARNGEDMTVRDMGPLWMVYPYDSSASYRNEVVYSRSVWQLDQILITTAPPPAGPVPDPKMRIGAD